MTNNTDDDDAIEAYSEYKAKKMIRFLNSKQEKAEKPVLRSEKLVEAMKSNWIELHNTYKGYDPVPGSDEKANKKYDKSEYASSKQQEHVYEVYDMRPEDNQDESSKGSNSSSSSTSPKPNEIMANNKSHLKRAPSLDSLINSSASDSSLDDQSATHSDSDSGADLGHLFPKKDTSDSNQRFNEMSEMINKRHSEICQAEFNEAYREKSTKNDFKKCGHKNGLDTKNNKKSPDRDIKTNSNREYAVVNGKEKKTPYIQLNGRKNCDLGSSISSVGSRKFSSFSTGSSGPMETIIEETSEPKVSVKEILARFETLSEKSEVTTVSSDVIFLSVFRRETQHLHKPFQNIQKNLD